MVMVVIIMLKRKFMNNLLDWKKSQDSNKAKQCLLVKGARQVGKSTIIEEFGKTNYENFISLDFRKEKELGSIFDGSFDVNSLIGKISLLRPGIQFVPGKTLLLLDEIQDCPNARASLKYWALDGRFDVIASGSLLGVSLATSSVPVGYEKTETLHAMDFEEFLWALGINETAIDSLKPYFSNGEHIPDSINNKMFEYLRTYMITGGMPNVINQYLKTHDFFAVDQEQKVIIDGYHDDIACYTESNERIKARSCYESIPRQLLKDNHKFQYKEVKEGKTASYFMSSIDWIENSGIATRCYNLFEPAFPIKGYIDETKFRLYMNDIGLLIASYGYQTKNSVFTNQLYGNLKGAIYESLIADFLIKKNYPLVYYKNQKGTLELEFFIEKDSAIIPVEVKAKNSKTASLNTILENNHIPYGYKFITGNSGIDGKKITLPLYMAMFL